MVYDRLLRRGLPRLDAEHPLTTAVRRQSGPQPGRERQSGLAARARRRRHHRAERGQIGSSQSGSGRAPTPTVKSGRPARPDAAGMSSDEQQTQSPPEAARSRGRLGTGAGRAAIRPAPGAVKASPGSSVGCRLGTQRPASAGQAGGARPRRAAGGAVGEMRVQPRPLRPASAARPETSESRLQQIGSSWV